MTRTAWFRSLVYAEWSKKSIIKVDHQTLRRLNNKRPLLWTTSTIRISKMPDKLPVRYCLFFDDSSFQFNLAPLMSSPRTAELFLLTSLAKSLVRTSTLPYRKTPRTHLLRQVRYLRHCSQQKSHRHHLRINLVNLPHACQTLLPALHKLVLPYLFLVWIHLSMTFEMLRWL